jgi:2-polyprenyl-6-methoxyphenol hydroxylase-like FAD-dependent oxidoreductase
MNTLSTRCCIAGGGPAGLMLGYLLARAGIDVVVLEKHRDFLRDFRGDTVHPSTLEVMYELGVLDEFLARPHQEFPKLVVQVGDTTLEAADFTHLPTHCKFLVLMPQWDFLDFLAGKARGLPSFRLIMQAAVEKLIEEHGGVAGVRAATPDGPLEIRAELVVGADGRSSVVRRQAGLEIDDLGAPMDVLWFRLSKAPTDPEPTFRVIPGAFLVTLDRGDYWQCGLVIAKGSFDAIRSRGLEAFGKELVAIAAFLADRVEELHDWNQVSLLTVKVDRLRTWCRPGLLCIGDAAHAMSPVGGIGINLAIQDAVAAANVLAPAMRGGRPPTMRALRSVQRGRQAATVLTQSFQVAVQNNVLVRLLRGEASPSAPWPVRLLKRYSMLRRIPAYVIGVGFRPEHVRPDLFATSAS